jgi:hypothetical protein
MHKHEQITLFRLTSEYANQYYHLYARVFEIVLSEDFLQRKSWGWDTPGEFLVFGALSSEKDLIGAISFFPRNFILGDQKIRFVEAADVMVCPSQRGRSVFLRLIQYSLSELRKIGIPLVYGFPNENSLPGWRKAGMTFAYQAKSAIFLNRPVSVISRKVGLESGKSLEWMDDFVVLLRRSPRQRYSVCVSPDTVQALASFHNKMSFPGLIEREKTRGYFKWRYSWGGEQYRSLVVRKSDRDIAYFIVKVTKENFVIIYDMGFHDTAELRNVMSIFVNQGMSAIEKLEDKKLDRALFSDLSGNGIVNSSFGKAGFCFRGPESPILMQALTHSFTSLVDHKKWNLMLADNDSP